MKNAKLEKIKLERSHYNIFVNIYNQFDTDLNVKNVFIICHGFDSKKDGGTTQYLVNHLKDYVLVSFDFPMHGESMDSLTFENCIEYLKIVDEYVRNKYKNASISLFGTSFGAFVILNYLKNNNNKYNHIILKSPAINMEKIFREILINEDIESYKKRGYTIKNRNKVMEIPYSFYESLIKERITVQNIEKNRKIIIFHGYCDDVALFDDLKSFVLPNIEINVLDGAKHSFSDDELSIIIKKINSL